MNKDTLIKIGSIVGASVVLFLLYKKFIKPTKSEKETQENIEELANAETNNSTESGYEKYKVTTKDTSLNIRETPSTNGKKLGKLNKGQDVLLKKSSTDGWMEYSTNGTTTFGYVSSAYVTKA